LGLINVKRRELVPQMKALLEHRGSARPFEIPPLEYLTTHTMGPNMEIDGVTVEAHNLRQSITEERMADKLHALVVSAHEAVEMVCRSLLQVL
jgi:hypothetical protein